jgi:hypothetical protein
MRKIGIPTFGIVAAALVATSAVGAAAQSPSAPAASPGMLTTGPLAPGRYLTRPFDPALGGHDCMEPPQAGCVEDAAHDGIGFLAVPAGWSGLEQTLTLGPTSEPDGAGLAFNTGPWLHSDPCLNDDSPPDIAVGPTVEDYARALADHPLLEVTEPVDVTLSGYRGQYLELRVPADLSDCAYYMPWEPGIWAQGPDQRWQIWILDVEGSRVLVVGYDYPTTSPERQAELASIVESIEITTPSGAVPSASPSP